MQVGYSAPPVLALAARLQTDQHRIVIVFFCGTNPSGTYTELWAVIIAVHFSDNDFGTCHSARF